MSKSLMAAVGVPVLDEDYSKEIEKARQDLRALIFNKNCARILFRLAWHDAGTYDAIKKTGGPNGSIRNKEEYMNASNTDLKTAIDLCEEVKAKHPRVTYADLYPLDGVVAVEVTGGPTIDFRPGRKDSNESPNEGLKEGPTNLRGVFHRMGLSHKDMVALSGGKANLDKDPFKFDNSYFKKLLQKDSDGLELLPTAKALMKDPNSRTYVQLYAKDKEVFLKDYAESHKKLSELGFKPIPISQEFASKLGGLVGLIVGVAVMLISYIIISTNFAYAVTNRRC